MGSCIRTGSGSDRVRGEDLTPLIISIEFLFDGPGR